MSPQDDEAEKPGRREGKTPMTRKAVAALTHTSDQTSKHKTASLTMGAQHQPEGVGTITQEMVDEAIAQLISEELRFQRIRSWVLERPL